MGITSGNNPEAIFILFVPGVGEPILETLNAQLGGSQWNLVDTVSRSIAKHHFVFGIDYRHIRSQLTPVTPEGEAVYLSSQSVVNNSADSAIVFNNVASTPIFDELALFAQDEWRLRPQLNLSLGLRWEVNPPPSEASGNDAFTVTGNINNPSSLALAPRGTPLWKTPWYNFAPRLGVAWQPYHTRPGWDTVVRTGGGVFFDTDNQLAASGYDAIGFSAHNIFSKKALPFLAPDLVAPPLLTPPYTSNVVAFPEHLQLPYTLEWNVSLQQALGTSQAITISYVGSNARRLAQQESRSIKIQNPNFSNITFVQPGVTSNYQALQLTFQRTVNHGIQALASYTWSHSIDFGSSDSALPAIRGNSDFDVRIEKTNTTADEAQGYRIPFESSYVSWPFYRKVFLVKKQADGKWTTPEAIKLHSPFTGKEITEVPQAGRSPLGLSLSPTGTSLLLMDYEEYPESWVSNPVIRIFAKAGYKRAPVLVLQDLRTAKTSMPADIPQPACFPLWADDGESFLVLSGGPLVGSPEERSELLNNNSWADAKYLVLVRPEAHVVEVIASTHDENVPLRPLWWGAKRSLMVRTSGNTISTFSRVDKEWCRTEDISIPFSGMYPYSQLTTDGVHIVGDYQDLQTPPELFTYERGQREAHVFAKLNPEFDQLLLATGREIQWKTASGYDATGLVLMPPHYDPSHRYPLVIQDYPWYQGEFLCDSGPSHDPSFMPQPLADAGMMYFIRTKSGEFQRKTEAKFFPKAYPGGLGEAAFHMDLTDSAIDHLDKGGFIDATKVVGFSRGGWYTEFTLSHSKMRYAAASTTDNIRFSMSEYWIEPKFMMTSADNMYGGPPYGPTLQNWLDHSISFNLDKIHTPLLIERMGYGHQYNDDLAPPLDVSTTLEILTGLSRLNKPVELYFYPNETHSPENPQARLANYQRNYDWYRFWLQGYERPNPEDPDQYIRWRKLRTLRDRDSKTRDNVEQGREVEANRGLDQQPTEKKPQPN